MSYELHCGDALQILPTLAAGSIDAILTDLPYQVTNCSWDTIIPFEPMWVQVRRLLKPRGVFVTTASQPFTSALVMSNPKWFRYEWIWEKDNASAPALAKIAPMKYHENVLVFSDNGHTYNSEMWNAGMVSNKPSSNPKAMAQGREKSYLSTHRDSNLRFPKSILRFNRPKHNGTDKLVHPTQKPVALYAYLIRTYTNPGDTVLDFCMGSGTTGVAALKEGRNFIGVELDEHYYNVGRKRMEDAAAQPMLFPVEAA